MAELNVMADNSRDTAGEKERRAKACIPCKLGRRKCNHSRPCGQCCRRNLEAECLDEVKEVDPPCTLCKKRKVKCDRKRPCGRCYEHGTEARCVVEEILNPLMPLRRQPDSDFHTNNANSRGISKRVSYAALLQVQASSVPSVLSSDSAGAGAWSSIIAPERPIAFPEGPYNGFSYVAPPIERESPWPTSLVRMFKTCRVADVICQRILRNLSPKLMSTVLRIFRAIDIAFINTAPEPIPPAEWHSRETDTWESSMRCGLRMVRVDKAGGILTGVDVNPFWTDLAGLHKEEYISRTFNGDINLQTSELRQFVKIVLFVKDFVQLKIAQQISPGAKIGVQLKPVYGRFSRHWGRDNGMTPCNGLLTRLSVTTSVDPQDPSWLRFQTSLVIVSPEEFEAVRAKQPELCEGYMVPVVGSKSAQDLMDPRLLVEESFEHMNSSGEGRGQMDRLAEVLSDKFSFMFDFMAQHSLPLPAHVPVS